MKVEAETERCKTPARRDGRIAAHGSGFISNTQRLAKQLNGIRLEFPPVGSAGSAERSARERLEFNNTVSSVFSTWLEGYPEDFHALGDPSLLERLVEVLRTRLPGSEVKGRAHMLLREVREEQQTHERRVRGTVPYLGTFLTDLVMLDTAVKDHLENGYINFDKRRKEFEIIAQIRLLQSSCKNSTFQTDESFMHWYSSLPRLSEAESLLSSIASPAGAGGFKAWDKLLPLGSPQGAGEGWSEYLEGSDSQLKPVNPLLSRITKHMKSPSVSCLDAVASAPGSNHTPSSPPSTLTPPPGFVKSHRRSASCGSAPPLGAVKAESDMRIIRVEMGLEDGNMYRSILVSSNDKAPTVISKALEKHNQDPSKASQYELVQVLPEGKELTIPSTGNVFYAMTSSSVDFLLRKKGMTSPQVRPVSSDLSATFPRIKSKGLKIALNSHTLPHVVSEWDSLALSTYSSANHGCNTIHGHDGPSAPNPDGSRAGRCQTCGARPEATEANKNDSRGSARSLFGSVRGYGDLCWVTPGSVGWIPPATADWGGASGCQRHRGLARCHHSGPTQS
ncbi:UNVERIFIED_CONTAM: hypothetical protein FKN15_069240 [Acipenser sinensis]